MSYYKADYSGSMIKTQCLHDNLPLSIFFFPTIESWFPNSNFMNFANSSGVKNVNLLQIFRIEITLGI